MAGGLFGYLLAGAAEGVGTSIVDKAKAKREAALKELEYSRLLDRDQAQRDFSASQAELQREFTAEQNDLDRLDEAKRAEADRYKMLSPEQAEAMGLDPKKQWQVSGDNKVSEVGGGGTTVNVDMKGQTKYAEERGAGFAKAAQEIEKAGQSASSALTSLSVMENAMNDPGFYSGAGSEIVKQAKRVGAALGLDPDGIDSMEAFNAQAKSAALDAMGGSLGTGFSNADRDFVLDQVPTLDNTIPGNKRLIDIQKKLNQRKVDIAKRARDYEDRRGQIDNGFYDELSTWAEQNPLFPAMTTETPRDGVSGTTTNGLNWSLK